MNGLKKSDKIKKYIYYTIKFSHKKNEILPFVTTWMDLEGINAK